MLDSFVLIIWWQLNEKVFNIQQNLYSSIIQLEGPTNSTLKNSPNRDWCITFETPVVHFSHRKTLMKYETRFAYPPVIQTNRKFVSREPSKRLRFTSHQLWKKEKGNFFVMNYNPWHGYHLSMVIFRLWYIPILILVLKLINGINFFWNPSLRQSESIILKPWNYIRVRLDPEFIR